MGFDILSKKRSAGDAISQLTTGLSSITANKAVSSPEIGKMFIAAESIGVTEGDQLETAFNSIESSIKTVIADLNLGPAYAVEEHNILAGSLGALIAADPRGFLSTKLKGPSGDVIVMNGSDANSMLTERAVAAEAYDERENRNSQLYTMVYNMMASRQDEFGETFFPTVVFNPNEVGATISIKSYYTYNDFKRSVTGALANYGRKSVVRAYADSSILLNNLTKAVPVFRDGGGADDNSNMFVDVADVPTWTEDLGVGVSVETGALKVDTSLDLIGISQTNELLANGLMDASDNLDAYAKLTAVYVKFDDGTNTDVVRINTEVLPSSVFTYSPQANTRRMLLALDSDGIVMNDDTVNVAGNAPASLAELGTYSARIHLNINGSLVLDTGKCIVNGGILSLVALRDASGNLVTGSVFNTLAAKIASAKVLGYKPEAYRANSNLLQRAQLLDSQTELRIINVMYGSPISAISPMVNGNLDSATALKDLITHIGIRNSNNAVTALLHVQQNLASYVPVPDANGELQEMEYIGHRFVKPVYFEDSIALNDTVDSIKSHERIKDIRAAIVEKIRYYANEMYRKSEYKAGSMVYSGSATMKPTVIIGTDPVLHNYIMADGDLRTLGETFDVKVVNTIDLRVKGKIFISFGVFDSARNANINPLNFGNMLYGPEITIQMPITRNSHTNNELIVTPRIKHQAVLPILTVLTVTGLPESTGKISMNQHSV